MNAHTAMHYGFIAGYLTGRGCHRVTVEFPGCVVVWAEDLAHPEREWWIGTANGTWEGDLNDETGVDLGHFSTGIPADEADPVRVARAILDKLEGK